MGLLDQAIREHLELKRRHGADPREIATAEREALLPLSDGQIPAWALAPQTSAAVPDPNDTATPAEAVQSPPYDWTAAGEPTESARGPTHFEWQEGAPGGVLEPSGTDCLQQETAEIDMDAVLGTTELGIPGEGEMGMVRAGRLTEPYAGGARTELQQPARVFAHEEESFEWHVIPRGGRHAEEDQPTPGSLALE